MSPTRKLNLNAKTESQKVRSLRQAHHLGNMDPFKLVQQLLLSRSRCLRCKSEETEGEAACSVCNCRLP
jgi:hypothetical protein